MVRIFVKYGESCDPEFIYDCLSTSRIDEIIQNVSQISNLQLKIKRFFTEFDSRLTVLHQDPKAIPLIRTLAEAKSYASEDQALHNKPLSLYVLRDHVQTIEKELKANYQLMGLSEPILLQQLKIVTEIFHEDTAQLWWAGKELMREKQLCDYIGRNEKTKITVKLGSSVSQVACNLQDMDSSNERRP